jgi:hypothetical protein
VNVRSLVFWIMVPCCGLVLCFGGTCYLHLQGLTLRLLRYDNLNNGYLHTKNCNKCRICKTVGYEEWVVMTARFLVRSVRIYASRARAGPVVGSINGLSRAGPYCWLETGKCTLRTGLQFLEQRERNWFLLVCGLFNDVILLVEVIQRRVVEWLMSKKGKAIPVTGRQDP